MCKLKRSVIRSDDVSMRTANASGKAVSRRQAGCEQRILNATWCKVLRELAVQGASLGCTATTHTGLVSHRLYRAPAGTSPLQAVNAKSLHALSRDLHDPHGTLANCCERTVCPPVAYSLLHTTIRAC